jgi:hypothetical protein
MPESYVSAINFLSFWTVIWFLKRLIEFPAAPVDWVTSSLDKTSATCFLLWGHGCLYCTPKLRHAEAKEMGDTYRP